MGRINLDNVRQLRMTSSDDVDGSLHKLVEGAIDDSGGLKSAEKYEVPSAILLVLLSILSKIDFELGGYPAGLESN